MQNKKLLSILGVGFIAANLIAASVAYAQTVDGTVEVEIECGDPATIDFGADPIVTFDTISIQSSPTNTIGAQPSFTITDYKNDICAAGSHLTVQLFKNFLNSDDDPLARGTEYSALSVYNDTTTAFIDTDLADFNESTINILSTYASPLSLADSSLEDSVKVYDEANGFAGIATIPAGYISYNLALPAFPPAGTFTAEIQYTFDGSDDDII